jgi:hypothetical protein
MFTRGQPSACRSQLAVCRILPIQHGSEHPKKSIGGHYQRHSVKYSFIYAAQVAYPFAIVWRLLIKEELVVQTEMLARLFAHY